MDYIKEKSSILSIIVNAFFTALISIIVSGLVQWVTLEKAVVVVSPSSDFNGRYLTVLSVRNLEDKTLSNFSLYFNTNFDVLKIQSSDGFKHQQKYVKLESIPPKAKYSVMVWTEQPILKDQIIAESDYKIRIDYSNDSSPFLIQLLWNTLPFAIVTFFATLIQILVGSKEIQTMKKECNRISKEIEERKRELEAQKSEQNSIQEKYNEIKKDDERKLLELKRELKEMRFYFLTNITQLRKELSFWHDTIRKILYNNKTGFQSADKVIEMVTSTLKTYATRKDCDKNMDELLYLSQLISDSRELHNRYPYTESKNNT